MLFLSGEQVFNTPRGKELQEFCQSKDDLTGHGAIRWFYGLDSGEGKDQECTDFSSPKNFPAVIVEAIRAGKMAGFGDVPKGLLRGPLYKDYQAKGDPLDKDYRAKIDPLYKDYQAKIGPLYKDYQAKGDQLDKDYRAKIDPLYKDYRAKIGPLYKDYQAKIGPLDKDYQAKRDQLDKDYWALFAVTENRTAAWR